MIISPIIEGLLGGWSTLQAATSAYISDCTSDGSRAQIFSRFTGVFYLGFSLGPVIGAYLIRHPLLSFPGTPSSSSGHNSSVHNGQPTVTSVFYVAAMCSFVNLLLVLFVFPESLDKKKSKSGIQAEIHSTVSTLEAETPAKSLVAIAPDAGGVVVGAGSWLRSFLGSLALFMPKTIVTPHGGVKRDWSLTILGLSLFMFLLASVRGTLCSFSCNATELFYRVSFRSSTFTQDMCINGALNRLVAQLQNHPSLDMVTVVAELLHYIRWGCPRRTSSVCDASYVTSQFIHCAA